MFNASNDSYIQVTDIDIVITLQVQTISFFFRETLSFFLFVNFYLIREMIKYFLVMAAVYLDLAQQLDWPQVSRSSRAWHQKLSSCSIMRPSACGWLLYLQQTHTLQPMRHEALQLAPTSGSLAPALAR